MRIPCGDSKHSIPLIDRIRSGFSQSSQNTLGVGMSFKRVTIFCQSFLNISVVINLAVKDHSQTTALFPHRLVPALEINNAQAAHAKRKSVFSPVSFVVRTTMNDGSTHAPNNFNCLFARCVSQKSYDATHKLNQT